MGLMLAMGELRIMSAASGAWVLVLLSCGAGVVVEEGRNGLRNSWMGVSSEKECILVWVWVWVWVGVDDDDDDDEMKVGTNSNDDDDDDDVTLLAREKSASSVIALAALCI